MLTDVTAAVAVTAAASVMTSIVVFLIRASRWPTPTAPSRHSIAAHADGYRPRPWDEVLEDSYPISAPPAEPEAEPIDELDPRWDWRAYLETLDAEVELVDA